MTRRILIFTGEGKGKTTAALGMAMRVCGYGGRVKVIQFIKTRDTGELSALSTIPECEIVQTGKGFVFSQDDPKFSMHQDAAHAGLKLAAEALRSGEYDLVVLDEVLGAISAGLFTEVDVIAALKDAAADTHIALTGRGVTDGLSALADTVTEMRCVKHAFDQGISATKGIEF